MNVLITGASRGIGRAAARLAGVRGWNVGVNYASNAEAAEATVRDVQQAGGRAVAIQADVTQEAQVVHMFQQMEQEFGSIHGVVVNAGIVAPSSTLADMSVDRLRRVFDTNVLGAYI
ncbi:hypothetical protein KC331_g8814, partial [Hortaea werneckii]